MKQEFRVWTQKDIDFKTDMNSHRFNDLSNKVIQYESDNCKEERIEKQYCKHCFYIDDHIGLSAMTISYCGKCAREMLNGSSNTDILCIECATERNLCVHCGARMD